MKFQYLKEIEKFQIATNYNIPGLQQCPKLTL